MFLRASHSSRRQFFAGLLGLVALGACIGGPASQLEPRSALPAMPAELTHLAFGACARQDLPQPVWDAVLAAQPDAFLFLGDNIYSKAKARPELDRDYRALADQPGFRRLRRTTPIFATWDDHDFGDNDGGADNPHRELFEDAFLDFFQEPADSPRRARPGIYDAHIVGPPGRRVQILLLDTRFFRSPLTRHPLGESTERGRYVPREAPEATMLGEAQWRWLEEQLEKPAELRILASSIQVLPLDHGWEKWGNLPAERDRLLRLLRETGAEGVILLSGDRHLGEVSRLPAAEGASPESPLYPLYEVTTGGLTHATTLPFERNRYRILQDDVIREPNFGLLTVSWHQVPPEVRVEIRSVEGKALLEHSLPLSDLRPGG